MRKWRAVLLALIAASVPPATLPPGLEASSGVWRLVDTRINPDRRELGMASSGITAQVGPNSVAWHKQSMDRGRIVENYTVKFTFGSPPSELRPGQAFRLRLQGSLEGTWPEGRGVGNTLRFSGYGGLGLPDAYGLDVNQSARTGSIDLAVQASAQLADMVTLEAGGLNWCPGCRIVWVYRRDPSTVGPTVTPPPPILPPPTRVGMTACDAWDVRLTQPNPITPGSRPTFTEWRGRWVRAPFAPCYQATWESLSTGQQIHRGVCPRDEGQVPSFWSDDGSGGRITYYTGTFGGPPGQIRGEYDYQKPGWPTHTGTWLARCYDPGPFPRPTW